MSHVLGGATFFSCTFNRFSIRSNRTRREINSVKMSFIYMSEQFEIAFHRPGKKSFGIQSYEWNYFLAFIHFKNNTSVYIRLMNFHINKPVDRY